MKEIAWKAQHRLHARYRKLLGRGKCQQQVVTAVGRELLGFIWAIGVAVEADSGRAPSIGGVAEHETSRTTAATVAVEGHTERRILERPMRQASGPNPRS